MEASSSGAQIIKEHTKELIQKQGSVTPPEVKEYIEGKGYNFTSGQYAGALRSLLDEPGYYKKTRGEYTYDLGSATSLNRSDYGKDVEINEVLEKAILLLKQVAIVDVLNTSETEINTIKEIPKIISALEGLKI